MNRLLAVSLSAPFFLIGAMHPGPDSRDDHRAEAARLGPITYRACRPGRGDDRCIQLYERGIRASYAAWQRNHPGRAAMGGPEENVAITHVRAPTRRAEHRESPRDRHASRPAAAAPQHREHQADSDHDAHDQRAHRERCNSASPAAGETRGM